VSAGSVVAAGLANGISPREICGLFVEGESPGEGLDPFDPSTLLQPAWAECMHRLRKLPRVAGTALNGFWADPVDSGWGAALARSGQLLPTGLFDNSNIDRYLRALFEQRGRCNDFREMQSRLLLVATDLDSGSAVEFGGSGFDYVPISRAVQASTALPLLFPPVTIAGRNYVDGALTKTMHASGAYTAGARLVFGVSPLVPYNADENADEIADENADDSDGAAGRHRVSRRNTHRALLPGGLPLVLSQTFRALIHSRMRASFAHYANDFPGLDFVLFEPDPGDVDLFFTNIFSYANRRRLCEHAYQRTRAALLARSESLAPVLARHGIALRLDVLHDSRRTLVAGLPARIRPVPPVIRELEATLAALTEWLGQRPAPLVS
jgi:predicted acylesterase/phospholipase RssA